MIGHWATLLLGMLGDAGGAIDDELRVGDLPMLTQAERQQLLVTWNDTAQDFRRRPMRAPVVRGASAPHAQCDRRDL